MKDVQQAPPHEKGRVFRFDLFRKASFFSFPFRSHIFVENEKLSLARFLFSSLFSPALSLARTFFAFSFPLFLSSQRERRHVFRALGRADDGEQGKKKASSPFFRR